MKQFHSSVQLSNQLAILAWAVCSTPGLLPAVPFRTEALFPLARRSSVCHCIKDRYFSFLYFVAFSFFAIVCTDAKTPETSLYCNSFRNAARSKTVVYNTTLAPAFTSARYAPTTIMCLVCISISSLTCCPHHSLQRCPMSPVVLTKFRSSESKSLF